MGRGLIVLAVVAGFLAGAIPFGAYLYLSWNDFVAEERAYLRALASAVVARSEHVLEGSMDLLAVMANSSVPRCSDGHLTALRAAEKSKFYIREIGVFSDLWMACTSSDAIDIPWRAPRPEWRMKSGFGVVPAEASMASIGETVITLTFRDHAVAVDPAPLVEAVHGAEGDVSVAVAHAEARQPLAWLGDRELLSAGLSKPDAVPNAVGIFVEVKSSTFPVLAVASEPASDLMGRWRAEVTPLGLVAVLVAGVIAALVYFVGRWRLSPANTIKYAVKNREFTAKYQPVVDLKTGHCVGAEALARWWRPDGTLVRPHGFIPFAEDNGLIELITDQMIKRIVEDLGGLLKARPDLHVAMNITPGEFQSDRTVAVMRQMVEDSGIESRQIVLEATERCLMDTNMARGIITKLRANGHRVSIDDFGTGYSSLSYLQTLHVDTLKIDKSFVEAIDADAATSGVVPHIIDMARTLNLTVIAEGVETEAQAGYLRDRGVPFAQGWLFSKALTASQFLAFADANPTAR